MTWKWVIKKLTLSTILRSRLSRSRRRVSVVLPTGRLSSPPKLPKRLPLNRQAPPRIPNPNIHVLFPHTRQFRLDDIMVPFLVDLDGGAAQTTGRVEERVVEEVGGGIAARDGTGGGLLGVGLVEELEEGAEEGVVERHGDGGGGGG